MMVTGRNVDGVAEALSDIAKQLQILGFDRSLGGGYGAIEGLSVAAAGEGLRTPIGPALNNVANSISEVAEAINRVADILESRNA